MENQLKSPSVIAALATLTIAIMGLLGYLPGMQLVGSFGDNYIPMAPSTALSFVLLGVILVFLNSSRLAPVKTNVSLLLTLLISLFGILEVIGYFIQTDLNFEDRLIPAVGNLNGIPIARMSPATGAAFFLAGLAVFFLLLQRKKILKRDILIKHVGGILGVLVLLISLLFGLAYLYKNPLMYELRDTIPMALTTALGLMCTAISILILAREAFPLQLLTGTSTRSYLLRYILPLSTLSVIFGGLTIHASGRATTINPAFISSALTVLVVLLTGLLATLISRHIGSKIDHSKAIIKQVNEALQESETRFRNLFENSEVSIWSEDMSAVQKTLEQLRSEGLVNLRQYLNNNPQAAWDMAAKVKVLHVNQATLKLFGAKAEDEFLNQIGNTFGSDALEVFIDELCSIWDNKQVFRTEATLRTLDGKELIAIISLRIPETVEGFKSIPVSILDITEQKQGEQALQQSQKMNSLGKLTGGIAHDYNNMLGVILGYSELLQRKIPDNPDAQRYLENIRHAAERSKNMTNKLLSFSRQKMRNAQKANINELLKNDEEMLAKSLTARIELILDLCDSPWLVWLDISELQDMILNMLINAQHAMPEGGILTLKTCAKTLTAKTAVQHGLSAGDYMLLSIIDTGTGIDSETLSKIFDPFFSTKGELGTGLGLSQVFGFVERNKGAIIVTSDLGHGTQFTLYFPRYRANDAQIHRLEITGTMDCSGHETLLVVDDEELLGDMVSETLAESGYQVLFATGGEEALQMLEKHADIDLMLSDVIMPKMNGFQLAQQVATQYPHIKIQMASGFSSDLHAEERENSLFKNMLHKPYNKNELLTQIRILLDT